MDLEFYKDARNSFSVDEWIDVLIAAADYNPAGYDSEEQKLHVLRRLLPFVEKGLILWNWLQRERERVMCTRK